jgi:hypothetical protein
MGGLPLIASSGDLDLVLGLDADDGHVRAVDDEAGESIDRVPAPQPMTR